jgi:ABC-2 type transport system ATP-binding protein
MDPESAQLVRHEIARLRSSQRAIIICTHNLVEAEMLADKIAIIYHGRILLLGTLEEMRQKLLGPAEYDVKLAGRYQPHGLKLPDGVNLLEVWENGFRYRVENPVLSNPFILRQLFQADVPVVAVQEVPRTLEMLYLKAMVQAAEGVL